MEQKLINIDSPIVPMVSIGNVKVGDNINQYKDFITDFSNQNNFTIKLNGNSKYLLNYKMAILLDIGMFDNIIYNIVAIENYKGCIETLTIKSKLEDFVQLANNSEWESDGFNLWNINVPSIFIGINEYGKMIIPKELSKVSYITYVGIQKPDNIANDYLRYGVDWYEKKDYLTKKWISPFS
jgi:hypothetical protein